MFQTRVLVGKFTLIKVTVSGYFVNLVIFKIKFITIMVLHLKFAEHQHAAKSLLPYIEYRAN